MKNSLKGLLYDHRSNKVSSTKFWNAIGMMTMTGMFIYLGVEKSIPEWMGWVYVFMITPSRLMKNLIDLRWGRESPPPKEENQ